MSGEPTREINLVEDFYNGLLEIQAYADEHGGRGRHVVKYSVDSAYNIIVAQPQAFPIYPVAQHPEREYGRAVFREKFAMIYRVTVSELTFLVVHSTKQSPPELPLTI